MCWLGAFFPATIQKQQCRMPMPNTTARVLVVGQSVVARMAHVLLNVAALGKVSRATAVACVVVTAKTQTMVTSFNLSYYSVFVY